MAQRVVDDLEVVQIHEEHRSLAVPPPCPREGVPEPVQKQRPVGQVGEGVVESLAGELILEGLPPGNIADHAAHGLLTVVRD
jgi:hypothetical protein